jgi:hypothetical protein
MKIKMPETTRAQLTQLTLTAARIGGMIDGLREARRLLYDTKIILLERHHPEINISKFVSIEYSILENAFHLKARAADEG